MGNYWKEMVGKVIRRNEDMEKLLYGKWEGKEEEEK